MQEETLEGLIYRIETTESHHTRLALLQQLEAFLEQRPDARQVRTVKSLLYHQDWYIRREVAFLVDRYGIPLSAEEQYQYQFALQQFAALQQKARGDPVARKTLFAGCLDPAPRIRQRIALHLRAEDCRTVKEEVLLHYAAGDYRTLVELGCEVDYGPAVREVLGIGLEQKANPLYHRKQCAFCLEQLNALEDASRTIAGLLEDHSEGALSPGDGPVSPPELLPDDPLQKLIYRLERAGLLVDGRRIYPKIQIGSVTGRITYRDPAVQTWPAEERRRRIQPETGFRFLCFDFICLEPALLINFLLKRFLLSLEDVPSGDLYLAVNPLDRNQGKQWFNAIINGGGRRYHTRLNPFQIKLLEAVAELRQELLAQWQQTGSVQTVDGRRLPLAAQENNRLGKLTNRLVQGSAADVFHNAVLRLADWLEENHPRSRIAFLLFDEVWVQVPGSEEADLAGQIQQVLETVNLTYQWIYPLKVRCTTPQGTGIAGEEPKAGEGE